MATLEKTDLVYYLAASIDGYIAKADGNVDWLAPYFVPELGFHDFISAVGTVAMGRATYDKIVAFGQWPYPGKPGLVVTHRPLPQFEAPVVHASGGSAEIASALAAAGPGLIGWSAARSLRASFSPTAWSPASIISSFPKSSAKAFLPFSCSARCRWT